MPEIGHDVGMLLHRALSGERAQATTVAISQFHRPPGSSGYHAATNLVAAELRSSGLTDIEVTTYPLDGKTVAGEGPLPLAWEPHSAVVRVVSPVPGEVVTMETASSCLAWWSRPTPEGGITAELVDLGTGEQDEDYAGKELTGKIVLIGHSERPGGWMHAARRAMEAGAKGILSDYLFYAFPPDRTRESHPQAVQLLRLPNQRGQFDAWACGISYPAAQRLRELLRLGPVKLHADIRCDLFEGHGQNLLATIRGRELPEESVYFIAHCSAATCPCANCAAGPALMVEIARTLHGLIERGELRRPRRSVKFLFIIEGLGSRAFIHENREALDRVRTAFCFDSVGHDQGKLKSVLLFYRHPDSSPSFINDYFAGVMERAPMDGTWVFANDTGIPPVQFRQAPYTPWSDNHIWAAYGVPSPLLMSWPDLHFHTQFLTADNTDPRVFRRAGVTTALAAYEIADAGPADALAIAGEVAARAGFRLEEIASRTLHRLANAERVNVGISNANAVVDRARRELAYTAARDQRAIASAKALVSGEVPPALEQAIAASSERVGEQAEHAAARLDAVLAEKKFHQSTSSESGLLQTVLRQRHEGPGTALTGTTYPQLVALVEQMQAQDQRVIFDSLRPLGDEQWNLIDGERTFGDIVESACLEFGFALDPELFVPLMERLIASEAVEVVSPHPNPSPTAVGEGLPLASRLE